MTEKQFGILVVCHANLCRSPMGERLLRRGLLDRLGPDSAAFEVTSAGTHATADLPMHPLAAEVLASAGIDSAGFRSRRLTAGLVAGADLVLTATRQQRSACVSFAPAAVRKTFTLTQFGRYAAACGPIGGTPPERLRALLGQVPMIRAALPVAPAAEDDLPDPVNQPIAAFRQCGATLERIVDALAAVIAPTRPAGLLRP